MDNPLFAILFCVLLPVGAITFIASHYPSSIERRAMANKARVQTIELQPKPIGTEIEVILPNGQRLKAEEFLFKAQTNNLE